MKSRIYAITLCLGLIYHAPATALAGEITPSDGLWQANAAGGTIKNCNPMVEGMLAGNGMLNRKGAKKHIAWGGRFDPDAMQMFNGDGAPIAWTREGENAYSGQMFDIESCSGEAAETCSRVGARLYMKLASPDLIHAKSTIDFAALTGNTEGLEEMAGLGLQGCEITTSYEIIRLGDG